MKQDPEIIMLFVVLYVAVGIGIAQLCLLVVLMFN